MERREKKKKHNRCSQRWLDSVFDFFVYIQLRKKNCDRLENLMKMFLKIQRKTHQLSSLSRTSKSRLSCLAALVNRRFMLSEFQCAV